MKIAFIVGLFPALSETFILNQITGLIDRGHEVDIYPQEQGDTVTIHADVAKYELLKHTYYREAVPDNFIWRAIKGLGLLTSNGYKAPLPLLRSLNIVKYGRLAASLRQLYQVIPYLNRGSYEIIHCHFGPWGLLGAEMRKLGALQGKLITTFHGWDVNVLPRVHGNNYYKKLFRCVDLCTTSSNFIKQRVMALGADQKKLIKLPVGIDLRKFSFAPQRLEHDKINILTVGRLIEVKGIEYSIRAVAKVLQTFPDIRYQIVGEGILRKQLEALADHLGVTDHVEFLGKKQEQDTIDLYSRAHIFMLSGVVGSDGAEEGQGLVLLEAQACGIPVVASRVGGIPESLIDGKSGFLVPEHDVKALAERLTYLIRHPEIWPEMGKAGRAYVEENYDIDKLNDRLVEIYQELLND